ncbi:MAG TPA: type I phosphomannose isomerase catalytic subunit [Pirellulales bacterium]
MSLLYPLRFNPLLRRYLWGGRRLETLGKQLGAGSDYAESWEIVDRAGDQSVVAFGSLAGHSLGELVREHGAPLLGRHAPLPSFPLLFKFLDAHERLSLQVHPDDALAAKLDPPGFGKAEAWVILATDPGSYLYAGLRRGIAPDILRRELGRRTPELCVEYIEPRVGDCFFLPAGIVHALGPGLLVAEIQQASDTTYRLYDWGRLGPDGRPRELHVEAGFEAIDESHGPVAAQQPLPTGVPGVERLVASHAFVMDRWRLSDARAIGGDKQCHIIAVVEGGLHVAGDPAERPLARGDVMLLPAELGPVQLQPREPTVMLDIYLP